MSRCDNSNNPGFIVINMDLDGLYWFPFFLKDFIDGLGNFWPKDFFPALSANAYRNIFNDE